MRILVVGAGAVGGYFGARLIEAGRDVTFLVRPGRAGQIRQYGLRVISPHGDVELQPRMVFAGEINGAYDLVLLSVKAYALESAMNDFADAVGPTTMILPVLNGMRHVDLLAEKFRQQAVLGGVCVVSTDLGGQGEIRQLTQSHKLTFGEVQGGLSKRIRTLAQALEGALFEAEASAHIVEDMWQKWVLLASMGGFCCLMRGNVGEIEAVPGGAATALAILRECSSIAAAEGFPPEEAWTQRIQKSFSTRGSTLAPSMYRDLTKGAEVEAGQIIGDLLRRGAAHSVATPLLTAAYAQLCVYRARLGASGPHSSPDKA